jgi:hypothetical protein
MKTPICCLPYICVMIVPVGMLLYLLGYTLVETMRGMIHRRLGLHDASRYEGFGL